MCLTNRKEECLKLSQIVPIEVHVHANRQIPVGNIGLQLMHGSYFDLDM